MTKLIYSHDAWGCPLELWYSAVLHQGGKHYVVVAPDSFWVHWIATESEGLEYIDELDRDLGGNFN